MYRVMNRDETDWGYKRYDMKYDYSFFLRTYLNDKLSLSQPIAELNRERVEREYINDVILEGVPTLEDLGVTPTLMEDQLPYELKPYNAFLYYTPEPGEFPEPGRPKPLGKFDFV